MPDKRTHRGAAPGDAALFAPAQVPRLRAAVADYSWLLSRGYAPKGALKLVGDRFSLTQRQRIAVMRSACSDAQLHRRTETRAPFAALADRPLIIDGYNLLITVESALSGAVLLRGRDSCIRDLAGIHGTYRRVEETVPALEHIAAVLRQGGAVDVLWLFDRPVSNSGRLRALVEDLAAERDWLWRIDLAQNPDKLLARSDRLVITTDSAVLDQCPRWTSPMDAILAAVPAPNLVDLSDAPSDPPDRLCSQ